MGKLSVIKSSMAVFSDRGSDLDRKGTYRHNDMMNDKQEDTKTKRKFVGTQ